MSTTNVYFDIPQEIEIGLRTGELVRNGGVVRNAKSGEIVSHLAEVGQSGARDKGFELAYSLLVKSGMESSTAFHLLNAAIPMLNFAMTGFHLYTGIMRVRQLEKAINRIYDLVEDEFRSEREAHLNMALEVAHNFNTMTSRSGKEANISPVDIELSTALERVFREIERHLEENQKTLNRGRLLPVRSRPWQSKPKWVESQLEIQQRSIQLILLGMHIVKLGSRCWLEIDEIDIARHKISDNIGRFEQLYEVVVEQLRLTDKAMMLQLDRSDLVTPIPFLYPFLQGRELQQADSLLDNASEDFVLVVEALQQLRGFDYELASVKRLGVPFQQREQDIETKVASRTTSKQDYVLLADDEAVSRLSRYAS